MGDLKKRRRRSGLAPAVVRLFGCLALLVFVAAQAGCSSGSDPEPQPPEPTLVLELLSTILTHGLAVGPPGRVAFAGTTMVVPLGDGGIDLYGIGDPSHPVLSCHMSSETLGGRGGEVAAAAGRAYVSVLGAAGGDEVVELDLSVPSSPVIVCRFYGDIFDYNQLVLRGNRLFMKSDSDILLYDGGVFVFDASQSPPPRIGQYEADQVGGGFHATAASRVFLARTAAFDDQAPKIDVVDMANPAAPVLLSSWAAPLRMSIDDIDVQQGRAYCAAYDRGILVLRGADQASLELEAEYDWSDEASLTLSIAAAPPYVFVGRNGGGEGLGSFQVFLHEGSSLTLVRDLAAELMVHSVAVSGNLLVTVEYELSQAAMPRKILKLYRILDE
jgi:hypothetical protein